MVMPRTPPQLESPHPSKVLTHPDSDILERIPGLNVGLDDLIISASSKIPQSFSFDKTTISRHSRNGAGPQNDSFFTPLGDSCCHRCLLSG